EEESLPAVAARRAPILIVNRIDLPVQIGGSASRLDRGDQQAPCRRCIHCRVVRRTVVVLDLLDGYDVRSLEVVDDEPRKPGEFRRRVRWSQVFDVECRDRELIRSCGFRRLRLQATWLQRG